MNSHKAKLVINILIPIILAILSFFVVAKLTSSTDYHLSSIKYLDEKRNTVLELSAASTVASTALTMMPGDIANPVANSLADLSSKFLLVLGAILLEKYLLTITGFIAFKILIPAACVLWIICILMKKEQLKAISIKLGIFAIACFMAIPTSIYFSKMIEDTYSASIQETIDEAKKAKEEIEEAEDKNILEEIIGKIESVTSGISESLKNSFNNLIDALAVMIVTSCVIPILVILFFIWLVKIIIGIEINVPTKHFNPTRKMNHAIKNIQNSYQEKSH